MKIKIPIVCETPGCSNGGLLINVISEVPIADMDLFYESYDGSDDADYCVICGELGIAQDPIMAD